MTVEERVETAEQAKRKSAQHGRPGWHTIADQFSRTAESHKPCRRCGRVLLLVQGERKHHGLCNDCGGRDAHRTSR